MQNKQVKPVLNAIYEQNKFWHLSYFYDELAGNVDSSNDYLDINNQPHMIRCCTL